MNMEACTVPRSGTPTNDKLDGIGAIIIVSVHLPSATPKRRKPHPSVWRLKWFVVTENCHHVLAHRREVCEPKLVAREQLDVLDTGWSSKVVAKLTSVEVGRNVAPSILAGLPACGQENWADLGTAYVGLDHALATAVTVTAPVLATEAVLVAVLPVVLAIVLAVPQTAVQTAAPVKSETQERQSHSVAVSAVAMTMVLCWTCQRARMKTLMAALLSSRPSLPSQERPAEGMPHWYSAAQQTAGM